jgi:putative nucleotidyltransferase with HDIG domain
MPIDTVLVVDDDQASCETLGDILELQGYTVLLARTGKEAEGFVVDTSVNAALLDLRLPDRNGLEILRFIKQRSPDTEVLMISGYATLVSAIEAMRDGAFGYVQKPVNVEEVLSGLRRALERQRMAREIRQANEEIRERIQELELLIETTRLVSSSLELVEVLHLLAQQMVNRLQVTLCHISVLEGDAAHLNIRATFPVREVAWELSVGRRIALDATPTYRRVLECRETVLLRADDPSRPLETEEALRAATGAGSVLLVPMIVKNRAVGVVTVLEARQWERSPFTPEKVKLCKAMASGAAIAIENVLLFEEREHAHLATLSALASALDARERETHAHSARVQAYTLTLARAMKVPEGERKAMGAGALLHDVGKIGIQDAILLKPGALTDEEWAVMRRHPLIGAEILKRLTHLEGAREIVVAHQERWDGSGYPAGLKATAIPLCARIFAVADAFDAMTSDRPYRKRMPYADARNEIARCAGTQFDPMVVEAFLAIPQEVWEEVQRRAETVSKDTDFFKRDGTVQKG